jgi:hypothetical protein
MRGRGQESGEGSSNDNNERYQQHPQRRRLPIVVSHLLGQTIAIAETQLSDPPGFFFVAMPPKRTPVKSVSDKRVEPTSARKTRAQLAAETTDSEEIRPDNLGKDAGAMEEGSQIPWGPGPSGGRGGQLGVGAQTGVTRDAATAHLVSDNQESEDTLSIGPSKRFRASPRKKGRFDQREPEGDTALDCSRSGGQKLSTADEPNVPPLFLFLQGNLRR